MGCHRERLFVFLVLSTAALCRCSSSEQTPARHSARPQLQKVVAPSPTEPWNPAATISTEFAWGLVVTDVTAHQAMVSIHSQSLNLSLTLLEYSSEGWQQTERITNLNPVDGVVQHELTDLKPNTAWAIAFTNDNESFSSPVAYFRSSPETHQSRTIRFAASSCLGNSAKPWPTLSRAAEEHLDFFVLAGDTVYADTATSLDDYRSKWRTNLQTEGLKRLRLSTSLIHTWDDHEVTNNWSWRDSGIEERYPQAIKAYHEALPWRAGAGESGLWRHLNWGRTLDVMVMDTRSERRHDNFVSPEQMAWLKTTLKASQTRFKIIVTSVPITDLSDLVGNVEAQDRWQGHRQRTELIDFIANEQITGVLFITGDIHYGQLANIDPIGGIGYPIFEIVAGPAGSFINPLISLGLARPTNQYIHLIDTWSYTLFEANPDDGSIRIQFIDKDGVVLAEETLSL